MPFDFKKYDAKCATLDPEGLQREWEHYTRLISGAATSTAVSGVAVPFTLGVSAIGVGLAAPAIHNARKKREIIERHLQRHGKTHHTRKRDVITAGAISGTVGVVTLGLAPVGADAICNSAAEHGIAYIAENEIGVKIATHLALDAAAVKVEEAHMQSKKEKEGWKAYAKAVKAGRNPSLPSSDLKIPLPANVQAVSYNPTQFVQSTPMINIAPPSEWKLSAEAPPTYFPPPPSADNPVGLYVDNKHARRHSTSDLPLTAQPLPTTPSPVVDSKLKQDSHYIIGTTTAITAPMVAGNDYFISVPTQPSYTPYRPQSVTGGESGTREPVYTSMAPSAVPRYAQDLPLPGLPPRPNFAEHQQTLSSMQRPRAYSNASFNSLPSYEMHQQSQFVYGTSPLPPPPPPMSPMSPVSPMSSPPPMYNTTQVHPNGPIGPSSPPTTPFVNHYSSMPPPPQPYQPNHLAHNTNSNAQYFYGNQPNHNVQFSQPNYTAPPIAYLPIEAKQISSEMKAPQVCAYEVQDVMTPMSELESAISTLNIAPSNQMPPNQQQIYPNAQSQQAGQQQIYFPPPPVAY